MSDFQVLMYYWARCMRGDCSVATFERVVEALGYRVAPTRMVTS